MTVYVNSMTPTASETPSPSITAFLSAEPQCELAMGSSTVWDVSRESMATPARAAAMLGPVGTSCAPRVDAPRSSGTMSAARLAALTLSSED